MLEALNKICQAFEKATDEEKSAFVESLRNARDDEDAPNVRRLYNATIRVVKRAK